MKKNIMEVVYIPLFALLVVFPLLMLILRLEPKGLAQTFSDPFFWKSVYLTFWAALGAALLSLILAIGFGYYHLFKPRSAIYKLAFLMNELPLALPHTVAGLALLIAFGRRTMGFLGETGLAFTPTAVVIAMFLASYPLAARALTAGLDSMAKEVIEVARTLGDTPVEAYFKVALPSVRGALFSGFVLAYARALSEFATVALFGGNVAGRTQVLASYVFSQIEAGHLEMAVAAGAFSLVWSLAVVSLLSFRRLIRC